MTRQTIFQFKVVKKCLRKLQRCGPFKAYIYTKCSKTAKLYENNKKCTTKRQKFKMNIFFKFRVKLTPSVSREFMSLSRYCAYCSFVCADMQRLQSASRPDMM